MQFHELRIELEVNIGSLNGRQHFLIYERSKLKLASDLATKQQQTS